jgi:CBS domain-containing membrane protein
LTRWIQRFLPHTVTVGHPERVRACIGALFGLGVAGSLIHLLPGYHAALPLLAAPMGASAVLVFAVPSSPLAQPWSVIGGNTIGAAVGVTVAMLIPDLPLAGAVAVALTVALMFALRCVHPPSGAVALTAAFGGPAVHPLGFHFVAAPIALQSTLLVCLGLVYHALTGHRYPHSFRHAGTQTSGAAAGFARQDLKAVIARRGEWLDIDVEDLEALLRETQLQACARSFNSLRCADIMSGSPITVRPETSTLSALRLLVRHAVKALPVTDADQRLVGIVTRADLVATGRAARTLTLADAAVHWFGSRRREMQSVGAVMTKDVCSVGIDTAVTELVPLFAHSGHHHIPVIDDDRKVAGMITESDVIAGLYSRSTGLESKAA